MAFALLILRVVLGIIFIAHGGQKLFGLFGGEGIEAMAAGLAGMGFPAAKVWAYLAGGAEFFGGIAVLIGFLTRLGAAGLAAVMLVAVFKVHWAHGLIGEHGFEYPLANLAMALALLITGAGQVSLDALIWKKS